MVSLQLGDKAPDFCLSTDGDSKSMLSDLNGIIVVLYFYPRDMTPGCTRQAEGFRDAIKEFSDRNAKVVGVSKDSPMRHSNFQKKYNLPFTLVSDSDGTICDDYGVWVKKKNYGRTYMGIERSTFLINEKGIIFGIWRKVRVAGHVQEVLESLIEDKIN